MSVLDSSGLIDYLLGRDAVDEVGHVIAEYGGVLAPDVIVFELLAVLRREVRRGQLSAERAQTAIDELGAVSLTLFPSMPLRAPAWALRENLSASDALFLALAETLGEPLATKDAGLAAVARSRGRVAVVTLGGSRATQ